MRIKALREERGISQQQLAGSLGVLQSTVSNWESEVALPRTRQLPELARILGCQVDDLYVSCKTEQDSA